MQNNENLEYAHVPLKRKIYVEPKYWDGNDNPENKAKRREAKWRTVNEDSVTMPYNHPPRKRW